MHKGCTHFCKVVCTVNATREKYPESRKNNESVIVHLHKTWVVCVLPMSLCVCIWSNSKLILWRYASSADCELYLQFKCCGVHNYTEWGEILNVTVPQSCCVDETQNCSGDNIPLTNIKQMVSFCVLLCCFYMKIHWLQENLHNLFFLVFLIHLKALCKLHVLTVCLHKNSN